MSSARPNPAMIASIDAMSMVPREVRGKGGYSGIGLVFLDVEAGAAAVDTDGDLTA